MPRYSSEPRSRGAYLTGMGVVWTLLQLAIVLAAGKPVVPDDQTLAFGLAAGLLEASANLALIERLTHIDVGLASPIYRLNIIAVVALAMLLVGEQLTVVKAVGVLLGLAAVVALYVSHPAAGR